MAADPNPALRAELMAALTWLDPRIRGLRSTAKASIQPATVAAVNEQIDRLERRRQLVIDSIKSLDDCLAALEILEADGYPALPKAQVISSIFQELQEEKGDIIIGIDDVFEPEPVTTTGTFAFPAETPKAEA